MSEPIPAPTEPTITVAGITFTADQVETATLKIDGRTIQVGKKEEPKSSIGFQP